MYGKIRRFAGSSVGAMAAAALAVGFTASEMEELLSQDLSKVFIGLLKINLVNAFIRYMFSP